MTSAGETCFQLTSGNDAGALQCLCMWVQYENNPFMPMQGCGLKQQI